MAVPKRRHSTGRKGKRRATIKIKLPTLIPCPHCGQLKKPHLTCPECGGYKEKVAEKPKKGKKEKKKSARGRSSSGRKK